MNATTTQQPKSASFSSDQPVQRAPQAPRGRKISDYGKQLAEKQKARREYGLREAQFHRYFERASHSTIATGQALLTSLELRLDNILYRSGMTKSRAMARQVVNHGLVLVNDARITVPSYSVKEGDLITFKKADLFEYNTDAILPDWLSYDKKKKAAKVDRLPKSDDLVSDINTQLIIEYYSR